jgi:DNA transformation protein and related proteins
VSVRPATRAFVLELFDDLGDVTARPMMGGLAVYSAGRIFAIVSGEQGIFLKASGAFAEAVAAAGGRQFTYTRDGRTARMGYWSLPESVLDDPEEACAWARRALAAAYPGFS